MWPDAWLNQLCRRHYVPRKKFDFQPLRTDVEPAGKDRGYTQSLTELLEEQPTQFCTVFHRKSVNATLSGDSAPPSAGVELVRKALNHKQLCFFSFFFFLMKTV